MGSRIFLAIILCLFTAACTTPTLVSLNSLRVGASMEEVLFERGSPVRVRLDSGFEVWTYADDGDARECQLFFKRARLARSVKCVDAPVPRWLSSSNG